MHIWTQDHDGYLDADDLRKSLGESADVMQLIKAADKNGDGKVGALQPSSECHKIEGHASPCCEPWTTEKNFIFFYPSSILPLSSPALFRGCYRLEDRWCGEPSLVSCGTPAWLLAGMCMHLGRDCNPLSKHVPHADRLPGVL